MDIFMDAVWFDKWDPR